MTAIRPAIARFVRYSLFILAVLAANPVPAAFVMTFNDTAPPTGETAYGFNGSYSEGEFGAIEHYVLTASGNTQLFSFDAAYTPAPNPLGTDFGGFQSNTQTVTLTQSIGDVFSLNSFQAAQIFGLPAGTIFVTGHVFATGAEVIAEFHTLATSFGSNVNWQTFVLPSEFTGLNSVEFFQFVPNTSTVIDNITLNAVPLPAAIWLFGSGVIGVAGRRRFRAAT